MNTIVERMANTMNSFLSKPPGWKDTLVLVLFTILITINPYYLNDRINIFELGLYLPGINALQHGLVPYRDFFHLRGPLELYVPAWLMSMFGTHTQVLCAYFFFGNVLCLVLLVLIAKEFIRSRYILYMMVPPIIARTYPRVTYMIWGGMRYALGLIAVYCLFRFLKTRRLPWIIATGLTTALAALVSIEMGVYAAAAVVVCLIAGWVNRSLPRMEALRALAFFIAAGVIGVLPWVVYSIQQGAFLPYLDAVWTIVTRMQVIIDPHLVSVYPRNFPEAVAAMVNPASINFKHMTPSYVYLMLLGYLIVRWQKGKWGTTELMLLALGIYGFIMYNTGFRGLWASQFEMALMPEKLLYFFFIESAVLWLWNRKGMAPRWQKNAVIVLVAALFILSVVGAWARYNKRFWAAQYAGKILAGKSIEPIKRRDKNEVYEQLTIPRARGIWVPKDQAKELHALDAFIRQTDKDDVFLMFPEMGMYHFLFDRPFAGRFPLTTFAWFNERWFEEYMADLGSSNIKYVVIQKKLPDDWYAVYWGYPPSEAKHAAMMDLVEKNYVLTAETEGNWIYRRK